jgi:hypothetical protein
MKRADVRKEEVKRVRQEGRDAADAGMTIKLCPKKYKGTMDEYQWENGYNERAFVIQSDKEHDFRQQLEQATTVEEIKEWLIKKFYSEG